MSSAAWPKVSAAHAPSLDHQEQRAERTEECSRPGERPPGVDRLLTRRHMKLPPHEHVPAPGNALCQPRGVRTATRACECGAYGIEFYPQAADVADVVPLQRALLRVYRDRQRVMRNRTICSTSSASSTTAYRLSPRTTNGRQSDVRFDVVRRELLPAKADSPRTSSYTPPEPPASPGSPCSRV